MRADDAVMQAKKCCVEKALNAGPVLSVREETRGQGRHWIVLFENPIPDIDPGFITIEVDDATGHAQAILGL